MKKFLTIAFVIVAASMFVSCSGKNLDDLIDVPDTGDTADSSTISDQNDTGQNGDTSADTGDSATDTGDTSADTGDTSADTGDTSADTGDTSADTGDSTADTGDSDNDGDNPDSDDDADSSDSSSDDDADSSDSSSDDDADSSDSDSDGDADSSDSNSDDDTDGDSGENQQKCTEITLINADQLSYKKKSSRNHIFKTTYTPNTGLDTLSTSTSDNLYIEFFISNNYFDNYSLAGTNWDDDDGYSGNGVSIYVYEDECCDYNGSNCSHSKMYFQRKGNVHISSFLFNSETDTLDAELSGVELEEVTINGANKSTPVPGGKCLKITDTPVHYRWY